TVSAEDKAPSNGAAASQADVGDRTFTRADSKAAFGMGPFLAGNATTAVVREGQFPLHGGYSARPDPVAGDDRLLAKERLVPLPRTMGQRSDDPGWDRCHPSDP